MPKIRGKQYLPKGVIHTPPTKNGIDSHRRTYRDWDALKIRAERNLLHANPSTFEGATGWAMPPACSPSLCLPNPDGGGRAAGARQISAHHASPGHLGHSTGGPVGAPGSPGRLDGLLSVQITATASLDQPPGLPTLLGADLMAPGLPPGLPAISGRSWWATRR